MLHYVAYGFRQSGCHQVVSCTACMLLKKAESNDSTGLNKSVQCNTEHVYIDVSYIKSVLPSLQTITFLAWMSISFACHLQHMFYHSPNAIKDVMQFCFTHIGGSSYHLVACVHMGIVEDG